MLGGPWRVYAQFKYVKENIRERNKDEKAPSLHGCTLHREEKVSLAIVN